MELERQREDLLLKGSQPDADPGGEEDQGPGGEPEVVGEEFAWEGGIQALGKLRCHGPRTSILLSFPMTLGTFPVHICHEHFCHKHFTT